MLLVFFFYKCLTLEVMARSGERASGILSFSVAQIYLWKAIFATGVLFFYSKLQEVKKNVNINCGVTVMLSAEDT